MSIDDETKQTLCGGSGLLPNSLIFAPTNNLKPCPGCQDCEPQAKPVAHTPGPWSIGHVSYQWSRHSVHVHVGESNPGNSICLVHMGGPGAIHSDSDSILANARLIASSPQLLIALQNLAAVNECWCAKTNPHRECYRCAALKVIAEATGREL